MADALQLVGPLAQLQKTFEELGSVLKNAVVGSLETTVKLFKELGTTAITPAIEGLKKLGTLLAQQFPATLIAVGDKLNGVIKTISSVSGPAIGALGTFGKHLGMLGLAFGAVGGAVVGVGLALAQFVQKANPAVFEQFMLAVNDLLAVIGRALVPLFQSVFIPVVRMAADVLMNLAPIGAALAIAFKPVVAMFGILGEIVGRALGKVGEILLALAPAIQAIGEVFVTLYTAVQPIYDLLIDLIGDALVGAANLLAESLKAVLPFIMAFAKIVQDVVMFIADGIRSLLALFGINISNKPGVQPGSSTGAATRSASHSSFEDVTKQAQRSAFSLGTASKEDPAKATADFAKQIADQAGKIYNFITELPQKMWDYIKELPKMIWDFLKELPGLIGKAVVEGPKKILEGAKGVIDKVPGVGLARDAGNWAQNQIKKPGLFGYTSINPF